MASAADIRSVLSVPDPTPGSLQPQKKPTATSKRPQGISRELYELIGDSVPSVVPQQSKARLKLKPNLGSGAPRSKWCVYSAWFAHFNTWSSEDVGVVYREWREFRNGARMDELRLSHWVKAGTDPDAGRWGMRVPDFWFLTFPARLPLRTLQRRVKSIHVHRRRVHPTS